MERRYLRSLGPLTEEELELLRGRKVLIAGCGGLGGYLAEYLLRLGVGHIVMADGDRFEASNLNRQLLCTGESLGRPKTELAAERAALVNPDVAFTAAARRLDAESLPALLRGCDAALDALDNVRSRRLLKEACDRQGIPCVFGAVAGWIAQAAVSLPGDGLLEQLYPPEYTEEREGVLPFTPALGAALQAALCVRLLCSRPVECGRLYCFDLSDMSFAELLL